MSSSRDHRRDDYELDLTPKRNYTVYGQQRKKSVSYAPNLTSAYRSPIISRSYGMQATGKPRTPTLQRQLRHYQESIARRDLEDGWIDDEAAYKKVAPLAPKKVPVPLMPRRPAATSVSRQLFAEPDAQGPKAAVLREQRTEENARLKREVEVLRSRTSGLDLKDLDRTRMECVQLRQENDALKRELAGQRGASEEIVRRDQYISAANKHHASVLETIKAKLSAEIGAKAQRCSELEANVRILQNENVKLNANLDAVRERHSKESSQLLAKMKQLVEERNRLILANAEQTHRLDRLYADQENQSASNGNAQQKLKHYRL